MEKPGIDEIIAQDIESLRTCPKKLDCASCEKDTCVKVVSVADFPTEYGRFRIIGFVNNKDRKDHIVIQKGELGDGDRGPYQGSFGLSDRGRARKLALRLRPPAPSRAEAYREGRAGHRAVSSGRGPRDRPREQASSVCPAGFRL